MFAPPVVLVAGSSPVGQLPSKEASLSAMTWPPRCGDPALDGAVPVDPDPPWLHATAPRSIAVSAAISWNFFLTRVLLLQSPMRLPRSAQALGRHLEHGARPTPNVAWLTDVSLS